MKIIWHRISIQTLLFQACLPTRQNGVENRDKAYCQALYYEPLAREIAQALSLILTLNKLLFLYF